MFDNLINTAGRAIERAIEDAIIEAANEVMHGAAGEEKSGRRRNGCIRAWLQDFRQRPGGVHLVIGKQRSGKTALCYFLAQKTGKKPIYAITAAKEVLPGVEVIYTIDAIPERGVCVVDDASLFFDSLRSKGDGDSYKALRDAVIVSEKQDICFLINVHDSSLLNKAAFSQCKSIIFKEPNLMSLETERPAIGRITQHVQQGFNRIPKPNRPNYFFLFSSDCKGWGKAPLPAGWSQKISTSCRIVDAEFHEVKNDEKEAADNPEPETREKQHMKRRRENTKEDGDSFEEFKRREKSDTKDNQGNSSSR